MNQLRVTEAEQALRDCQGKLGAMRPDELDLLAVEREVRELTEARGRELMAEVLARADTTASEVEIDGTLWGNRRVLQGEYRTMFGVVRLERSTYQRRGGGPIAIPLDLRLGIVEGRYTPKMARILTRAIAVTTEQEGAEFLAELGTAVVSSSTLSRIPRAIAARYETQRVVVECRLRERETIPDDAVTVQVALDGVMVPQDGEHARPRGRKSKSPDPPRHERRYGAVGMNAPADSDGRSGRAWHEASVGTLAFFDVEGRRLATLYRGRMPEAGKATLVAELEAELHWALAQRPTLNIVFASDGAAPQWAALEAMESRLPPDSTGHRTRLVDAFHVAQYVQKAADAIEGPGTAAAKILSVTWRETVKQEDRGAVTVLRSMRARLHAMQTVSRRGELEQAIGYIANQDALGRMNYADAGRRNYPIGTGITEAAAKTLVGTRMKRAGARFSQHGGQTILLFRAALLSGRFEALLDELRASYLHRVKEAA
jgi:hypothetical protein